MSEVTINGLIEGGKATGGPPFGPALGPLGVNVTNIINEINEKTKAFEGIKIPVKVVVNPADKSFRVEIGAPPTSALVMKEIGIAAGAKTKDEVAGNITIEQIKKIAQAKEASLYGPIKSKVKQIIGTCKSMNVTVEGMNAKEAMKKVESGELKV